MTDKPKTLKDLVDAFDAAMETSRNKNLIPQLFLGGQYDPVNGFRPLETSLTRPQPMPVPFSESDTPEQRRIKFHLNTNSIYGKFGTGKGPCL